MTDMCDGCAGEPVLLLSSEQSPNQSPWWQTVCRVTFGLERCLCKRLSLHWNCSGGRLILAWCWSFYTWQPHRHGAIQSNTGRKQGAVHWEHVQVHFQLNPLRDWPVVQLDQKLPGTIEPDKLNSGTKCPFSNSCLNFHNIRKTRTNWTAGGSTVWTQSCHVVWCT